MLRRGTYVYLCVFTSRLLHQDDEGKLAALTFCFYLCLCLSTPVSHITMIPPIAHVHVRVSHRQVDEAKLAALTSELEDARTAIAAAEDRLRAAEEASLSAADANERSAAETRAEADRLRQELDDATALAAKVAARHADKVRGIMHSQPFLLIFHHHRAYANVVAALMRHVSLQCVCTSSCYVHQVASLEASRDTLKQQMEHPSAGLPTQA